MRFSSQGHLSTEPISSTNPNTPLPPPPAAPLRVPRSRLVPSPRPANSHASKSSELPRTSSRRALPALPHNFGANQLLSVPSTTRALLEGIVAQFDAPIRYAFAYGSGVFEQDGYQKHDPDRPMLDFMFAVSHPGHWHSINLARNPSHYALHARLFGSDFVSRMQALGPGVWFNPYVTINGVTVKYGVTSIDTLCSDLLSWRTLYLAGRMHKPLRIIRDDARVRLTQQVNLTSALRTALLTLPTHFTERELFERIAGISYSGDPRMVLPAENRHKVSNIVSKQADQFRELYRRLAVGLPGVKWEAVGGGVEQEGDPKTRVLHLRKLPAELLDRVDRWYALRTEELGMPGKEADEAAYWVAMAGHARLGTVIMDEMKNIVRYPATVQTVKGLVSAGIGKSVRYGTGKMAKWWLGRGIGPA
ncbi:mitochondrial matrix Mmp37-domain-containing protein [Hysterangium stoloniferum]|nr:mitochondrial matrix Mmp37-domain-containing protein [Hysterangium stoloniferum]